MATLQDFEKIDVRVGVVAEVTPFTEGRYSTHILKIDFGPEVGVKKSLAKLAPNYDGPELVGRQILCVVNFHRMTVETPPECIITTYGLGAQES
jgi:tRNA-binding protein